MTPLPIPSHHRALIYDNPGTPTVQLISVQTPQPGPGDVLVRLTHSGICHSDWAVMMRGENELGPPAQRNQIGGHEGVGYIVAFGPPLTDELENNTSTGLGLNMTLTLGDRVGIKWMARVCGRCPPCRADRDGCCVDGAISGYGVPGTFQEYVVAPANYVTRIPDGVASELAAPLLCGGITVYAALRKCEAHARDAVVVIGGTGGLGHLALQIGAWGMGLRMIALDFGAKADFAAECGATSYIDMSAYKAEDSAQLAADVKQHTPNGLGAAAVLVCTGANEAYAQALSLLRFGGTLVCVGVPEGRPVAIASAFPASLIAKELRIVGSVVGNQTDAMEMMEMAARGLVRTRVEVRPMGVVALMEVFEEMNARRLRGRVVLDLTA
ncbi:chaperonin 10-like protein [Aspergillus carlsbadensis]|nr:chaperonin 10-like protein [Aspergillus carlsbadensis]